MFSSCRRRKSSYHSKPVNYYNRRHQPYGCFRNPIVVFCLSFLALGSLRFRVRTKQAAQTLIQRGRERISASRNAASLPPSSSYAAGSGGGRSIVYELVEGDPKKSRLQRYRALWSEPPQQQSNKKSDAGRQTNKRAAKMTASTTTTAREPVSVSDWVQHMLNTDDHVRAGSLKNPGRSQLDQFIQILQSGQTYQAYFFETKGVTAANAGTKPFEFVLVNAPQLQSFVVRQQQPAQQQSKQSSSSPQQLTVAFADQFEDCSQYKSSCVFSNLGGDAVLVAPKPLSTNRFYGKVMTGGVGDALYGHLASFVRKAPYSQVHNFWVMVLETYLERLLQTPDDGDSDDLATNTEEETLSSRGGSGALSAQARKLKNATTTTTARTAPKKKKKEPQSQQHGEHEASDPVWLSTSGMGVAWVHMRLDQVPKYYTYAPFALEQ